VFSVAFLLLILVVARAWGGGAVVRGQGGAPAAQRGRTTLMSGGGFHRILLVGQTRVKRCNSSHLAPPCVLREAIERAKGRASAQPYLGPRTRVRRHDDGWGARRAGW